MWESSGMLHTSSVVPRSPDVITAPSEGSQEPSWLCLLRPAEKVPGSNKKEEDQGGPFSAKPQEQSRLLQKMGVGSVLTSVARRGFLLETNSSNYWLLRNVFSFCFHRC